MWSSGAKCWVAVCSICAAFLKSDCNTKLLLLSCLNKLTENSAWHIWKPGEPFASRLRCYGWIWQSSPNPVLQQKSHLDPQRHLDLSWSEPWNNAGWRREEQGLFLSFLWNNADLSSHLCVSVPSLQLPFFALSVLDPTWCEQRLLHGLPLSLCAGFPFLASLFEKQTLPAMQLEDFVHSGSGCRYFARQKKKSVISLQLTHLQEAVQSSQRVKGPWSGALLSN